MAFTKTWTDERRTGVTHTDAYQVISNVSLPKNMHPGEEDAAYSMHLTLSVYGNQALRQDPRRQPVGQVQVQFEYQAIAAGMDVLEFAYAALLSLPEYADAVSVQSEE